MAKLIDHLFKENPRYSFRKLVGMVISQLEGAFACCFTSTEFPGEIVATKRGSPLIVGVKTEDAFEDEVVPIHYSLDEGSRPCNSCNSGTIQTDTKEDEGLSTFRVDSPKGINGAQSSIFLPNWMHTDVHLDAINKGCSISTSSADPVEFYFASDASAIIEHTNKVVFLEDDDVASVKNGRLNIHRRKQDGKGC